MYEQRNEMIIEAATETFIYDVSENPATIQYSECPITCEAFVNGDQICRILHCGHIFKERSIRTWFERSLFCPVCRYNIREYVNIAVLNDGDDDDDSYSDMPDLIESPFSDHDRVMSDFIREFGIDNRDENHI